MRYAAIREIYLNTEVNKPSIADVLEFNGKKMECAIESTPHEDTRIYSSVYDGGSLMPEFEENGQETLADGQDQNYPIRSEGIAPLLRMLQKGNPQKRGRGYCAQLAMLRHQNPIARNRGGITEIVSRYRAIQGH